MNILFLSELYYPHGSGAELATYLYAKYLAAAGHKVTVITNEFQSEKRVTTENNVTVYRLPLFQGTDSVKYSILKRIDILFSPFLKKSIKWSDIVYIPRLWYSAALMAKAYGKPVVFHLHDYIPICPLSNVYDFSQNGICQRRLHDCSMRCIYITEQLHRRSVSQSIFSIFLNFTLRDYALAFLRMSDAIVCISKEQKRILLSKAPDLEEKTALIYNPLPEPLNEPISGSNFGYFGGSDTTKGFQVLCKSLKYIKENNLRIPPIQATKLGDLDRKYDSQLRDLGFVPHGRLDSVNYRQMYSSISSVVIPSIWPEPWPYVTLEAILEGRLVIAASIGGIPEQVESSKAFLFEPGDYKTLGDYLVSVSSLRRSDIFEIGQKNKDSFLKRFSNEKSVTSFIKLCDSIAHYT
jgi:glycosyltransferase involved in cell wall biosynthesis